MFWDSQNGEYRFSLALVTGSTSGIGLALCQLLASKGINLIIHGRDSVKLNALRQELEKSVNVQSIVADLATLEGQIAITNAIAIQRPDLVINNAGFGIYGEVLNYTTEEQLKILEVDGQAVIRLSIEAARTLIANGQAGVIVNVSSAAAFLIFPEFALYSATKAMINQFSESFDEETKNHGVRVLVACPGVVTTQFRVRARGKELSDKDSIRAMTPEFAANEIWKQIRNGKKTHIFNWKYRFSLFFARYILPKSIVAKFMKKSIDQIKTQ